jgi:hypothetical protein
MNQQPADRSLRPEGAPEFQPFPKLPRLRRGCVITEKVDGTNAQIVITPEGGIFAASRTRYITPERDNFGFAAWVERNRDELLTLGPGRHFGEWYGLGIQRGYGLNEKRFALFNVGRWTGKDGHTNRPACCGVVPILHAGPFTDAHVRECLDYLRASGSRIVPGFLRPEGIVVLHSASGQSFKATIENDESPKDLAASGITINLTGLAVESVAEAVKREQLNHNLALLA